MFVDVAARAVDVLTGPSGLGVVRAVAEEVGDFGLVEMQSRCDLVNENSLMLFDGRGLVVKVVVLEDGVLDMREGAGPKMILLSSKVMEEVT